MVEAIWTGSYPTLCDGVWVLRIDGEDYSDAIPEELRHTHMNTFGTYASWHFEDWQEVFEDYDDGLDYEDWVAQNPWVLNLPTDAFSIFLAFQAEDWRHGSCGGCI